MKTTLQLSILILLFIPVLSNAQTFARTIGSSQSDNAQAVVWASDENFVTVGSTASFGGASNIFLVKTDMNGDTIWSHIYDHGGNLDYGNSIIATSDGGMMVAGWTFTSTTTNYEDLLLMKLNIDGEIEWAKAYGGPEQERGFNVKQTADGGYIIVGYTAAFGAGLTDIYLVKVESDGDIEWTKTYGGNVGEEGYSVCQNTDLGYTIAGTARSNVSTYEGVLIRTDEDGDVVWAKTYGGSDSAEAFNYAEQTTDGGFIATGNTYSFAHDVYVVKTDADGDEDWSKLYGGTVGDDTGFAIRELSIGGYIMTGYYVRPETGADGYLVRMDEVGDTLWTRGFGGVSDDQIKWVEILGSQGFMLAGHTVSSGYGNGDMYNIRTDADGHSSCSEFSLPTNVSVAPTIVAEWTPTVSYGGTQSDVVMSVAHGGYLQACAGVGVDDIDDGSSVTQIYPNPTSGIITLQNEDDILALRMMDMSGRVVSIHDKIRNPIFSMNVDDLDPGQYVLQVSSGKKIETLMIVIE